MSRLRKAAENQKLWLPKWRANCRVEMQMNKGKIKNRICAAIPKRKFSLPVDAVYWLATFLRRPGRKIREAHYANNVEAWDKIAARCTKTGLDGKKYIEFQMNMGGENALFFGQNNTNAPYTADYNSCEVIALYNALVNLQGGAAELVTWPGMLRMFERHGIAWGGQIGSHMGAVVRALRRYGYEVARIRDMKYQKCDMSQIEADYDCFIVNLFNDEAGVEHGIHTMCITKVWWAEAVDKSKNADAELSEYNESEAGSATGEVLPETSYGFVIHNDYNTNGQKVFDTLKSVIDEYNSGRGKLLELLAIQKKASNLKICLHMII